MSAIFCTVSRTKYDFPRIRFSDRMTYPLLALERTTLHSKERDRRCLIYYTSLKKSGWFKKQSHQDSCWLLTAPIRLASSMIAACRSEVPQRHIYIMVSHDLPLSQESASSYWTVSRPHSNVSLSTLDIKTCVRRQCDILTSESLHHWPRTPHKRPRLYFAVDYLAK